jgi:CRISPR-associated protein (TIGR03986 family)
MTFPKHIRKIEDPNRRAIAPYNFIELPDRVVTVDPESLPSGDRYHPERCTGTIKCTLTTESPLYTRCGWTPEDFAAHGDKSFHELPPEIKQKRANFFLNPITQNPVIPGSSIRGMLRTLVEIVSFSKIDRVSGHQRLFFRAVGSSDKKESWGKEYKQYVKPEIIKAGYLKQEKGKWTIQPAAENHGQSFCWVKESSLDLGKLGLKGFDTQNYEPQYLSISYKQAQIDYTDRAERLFAHDIDTPDIHSKKGILVTSGHMKQGDEPSPRRNHCIVFPVDTDAKPLELDDKAIEHYRNALTDFQKKSPFDKDWGFLKDGRPVFYYRDGESEIVGFFGQSPNFRIPYSPDGNGHATTVRNFIPPELRELASFDLADAIFGWVKQESKEEKLPDDFDRKYKQRAGRVFVTDALYKSNKDGIWYSESSVTPQILSEPKPTLFSHYLVQPEQDNPNADPLKIKHYASKPIEQTVIRGHKMYWHKGHDPKFELPPPKKVIKERKLVSDTDSTQTTKVKPIKQGVTFEFEIHFENLSDVELGALLWVLDLAQDDSYRLSLGMGKPLGMGAVKITHHLHISKRQERYKELLTNEQQWFAGYDDQPDSPKAYITKFDEHIRQKLGITESSSSLKEVRRIKMLLAMLRWEEQLSEEELDHRRYMENERDASPGQSYIGKAKKGKANEYAERPVLPTPLQVICWDKCDDNNGNSGGSGGSDRSTVSPPTVQSTKQEPSPFSEGQQIEAKVVDIQVQEGKKRKTTITYEINDSNCPAREEVYKKKVNLAVGDVVKVTVDKAQGRNIRKVKHL